MCRINDIRATKLRQLLRKKCMNKKHEQLHNAITRCKENILRDQSAVSLSSSIDSSIVSSPLHQKVLFPYSKW